MRRFLTRGNVVLTVLCVVTAAVLVLAFQRQAALSSPARNESALPPAPAVPTAPPSVAFVGDGWTSGAPAGGQGGANYTAILAGRDGWRVTNRAVYGSGYVAGATLAAQLPPVVDAKPQLVVVTAGRADSDADPDAVRAAAAGLYRDLRTRLPQAKIVVIGPIWVGGDAPRRMTEVRDAIRDSATAATLPFVDPIADRWFNGTDADGVTPDGDLNDRGHRRLADLVEGALRATNTLPSR